MNTEKMQIIERPHDDPFKIVTERLGSGDADLKSFYFRRGANFYVFSYGDNGTRRHTFIDTGDRRHEERIMSVLTGNAINPANIERMIITHRHHDHCGLADWLAGRSRAKILTHENFKTFVEGKIGPEEYRWLGGFKPGRLKGHDMVYLKANGEKTGTTIGGIGFSGLTEPISIGTAGCLSILGCPESPSTHSPDQLVVLYSPCADPHPHENTNSGFRLTDDIIFSGDLWLMHGPLFTKEMLRLHQHLILAFLRIKKRLSGKGSVIQDPREQDAKAKMALKLGFCLIRVKPGHGEEFLGTRLIPHGLLAKRDMLLALGYPMNADKSILKNDRLKPKVREMLENAHAAFANELNIWLNHGYQVDEISRMLLRIYNEQSGGGYLVKEDRKERRKRLIKTLTRLQADVGATGDLRRIADETLSQLPR